MATDKAAKPKKFGTDDIPSLIGKKVRFAMGRSLTKYDATVTGREGYRLVTKDTNGVERRPFPAACTLI